MLIEKLKGFENENWYQELITEIKENSKDRKIVIYGASRYGLIIADELIKNNLEVACICDDDSRKWGSHKGIEIKSLADAYSQVGKNSIVYIGSYSKEAVISKMKNKCLDLGFEKVDYTVKFMIFYNTLSDIAKNIADIQKLYDLFEDELSKETFINIIKTRISGNIEYLNETFRANQYFDEEIFPVREDVFFDVGAFNGDTILKFKEINNNKFKAIYAFEMDKYNCGLIKENPLTKAENIHVINKGVYNVDGEIGVTGNLDQNSHIDNDSPNKVEIIKIDTFVKDHEIPTFIKMDIEGAEVEALEGAKETIQKYAPRLAICVYHNFNDIFNIQLMLKEYNSNYKFYLRNHDTLPIEYVLYAK